MKKSLFITLLFSSALLIADDLIVDKKALSQYKTDDHLLFYVFNANCEKMGSKHGNDEVDLSDNAPILGPQFTQEAWIWADDKGDDLHRKIMGSEGSTTRPPEDRSPTISYHYNNRRDDNEIRSVSYTHLTLPTILLV